MTVRAEIPYPGEGRLTHARRGGGQHVNVERPALRNVAGHPVHGNLIDRLQPAAKCDHARDQRGRAYRNLRLEQHSAHDDSAGYRISMASPNE